jgi:hypothetical protein
MVPTSHLYFAARFERFQNLNSFFLRLVGIVSVFFPQGIFTLVVVGKISAMKFPGFLRFAFHEFFRRGV